MCREMQLTICLACCHELFGGCFGAAKALCSMGYYYSKRLARYCINTDELLSEAATWKCTMVHQHPFWDLDASSSRPSIESAYADRKRDWLVHVAFLTRIQRARPRTRQKLPRPCPWPAILLSLNRRDLSDPDNASAELARILDVMIVDCPVRSRARGD